MLLGSKSPQIAADLWLLTEEPPLGVQFKGPQKQSAHLGGPTSHAKHAVSLVIYSKY